MVGPWEVPGGSWGSLGIPLGSLGVPWESLGPWVPKILTVFLLGGLLFLPIWVCFFADQSVTENIENTQWFVAIWRHVWAVVLKTLFLQCVSKVAAQKWRGAAFE